MTQKHIIAKILREIAVVIDSLDQETVDQLMAGKVRLTITPTDKPRKKDNALSNDSEALWQKLNECNDRDEARQILGSIPRRDALASFAKAQKIHVTKQDRREDIENKLIEFVIGGKLRTEAIQTLNLKGGSGETQNS
jgi:hypothetical protein